MGWCALARGEVRPAKGSRRDGASQRRGDGAGNDPSRSCRPLTVWMWGSPRARSPAGLVEPTWLTPGSAAARMARAPSPCSRRRRAGHRGRGRVPAPPRWRRTPPPAPPRPWSPTARPPPAPASAHSNAPPLRSPLRLIRTSVSSASTTPRSLTAPEVTARGNRWCRRNAVAAGHAAASRCRDAVQRSSRRSLARGGRSGRRTSCGMSCNDGASADRNDSGSPRWSPGRVQPRI